MVASYKTKFFDLELDSKKPWSFFTLSSLAFIHLHLCSDSYAQILYFFFCEIFHQLDIRLHLCLCFWKYEIDSNHRDQNPPCRVGCFPVIARKRSIGKQLHRVMSSFGKEMAALMAALCFQLFYFKVLCVKRAGFSFICHYSFLKYTHIYFCFQQIH